MVCIFFCFLWVVVTGKSVIDVSDDKQSGLTLRELQLLVDHGFPRLRHRMLASNLRPWAGHIRLTLDFLGNDTARALSQCHLWLQRDGSS